MPLIVQKYGGTSVGSIERIQAVAQRALDAQSKGNQVILVSSAMSGETNRLIALAKEINPIPYSKEYDMLIASGEQVAIGLLSLAINTLAQGTKACPLLGYQLGIQTDSIYSKARIQGIDTNRIRTEVDRGVIPVIAGFQGVDPENNITTLGRGGSDTSAVAIAAAIGADECEIYTDVDGVYTTDPRLYSGARKIETICYEEMMELASLGAKVLQSRSVELAAKYDVPIHVRSSFCTDRGTLVVNESKLGAKMEQVVVSGVAADRDQVKFTLQKINDRPGIAADVFGALSSASVVVDIIVQDVSQEGNVTVSFTVPGADSQKAAQVIEELREKTFSEMTVSQDADLSKVSIVGVGMQHHPGVAAKMFQLLGKEGINIHLVTTSEIKVSCLVDSGQISRAVQALHQGFDLDLVE